MDTNCGVSILWNTHMKHSSAIYGMQPGGWKSDTVMQSEESDTKSHMFYFKEIARIFKSIETE